MTADSLRPIVAVMMSEILADLETMVAIPSIAFPGYPAEPVQRMASTTVELLKAAGFSNAAAQDVPDGYPPIFAEVPGPPGSPTVVLYAHYDVQPAPPEQGWSSDPWTAVRMDDGRVYGRGAADDKSGIAIHMGTMKAFGGAPPCTVKLIVEGMEETNSNLEAFVEANPAMFAGDVFVVADMGNLEAGVPILTTTLRGEVACTVTLRTLQHPLHSGTFGGPVPDALVALARLLASLHDDQGGIAVDGVTGGDWDGALFAEDDFRAGADLLDGVRLVGDGTVGSRLWSRPSVSAIGIDAPSVVGASNALLPEATAKISMRIVPGSDPERELDALARHLEAHAPWGAHVEVTRVRASPAFRCETSGPGYVAARAALAEAYGRDVGEAGSGGTIPLLQTLRAVAPGAEFILWGAEDLARSRIHASDESVDPQEIERMILSQCLLLEHLAAAASGAA
jgi:acetylornithine deacetylase/succinyl-diaminopimelate desuccinylase-like protein